MSTQQLSTKLFSTYRFPIYVAVLLATVFVISTSPNIVVSAVSFWSKFELATAFEPASPAAVVLPADDEDDLPVVSNTEPWTYDFSQIEDGRLSTKHWYFERGTKVADYNNEVQAYTGRNKNVRIENGVLVIEAHEEQAYGREYTSARIDTRNSFAFEYGTLEVVARAPEGKGTWPAAWLFPVQPVYNPRDFNIDPNDKFAWALNGEIDFFESVGMIPYENIPAAHSYRSLYRPTIYTPAKVPAQFTEFNTYGVIKSKDSITFTLNGEPYAYRRKSSNDPRDWPFDQSYYLIINLALGGEWAGSEGVDSSRAPWRLEIQSISYRPEK